MRKIYFPGLDGIRAIACTMVFFGHFSSSFGIETNIAENSILNNGVTCFFTLSGFLITSLLLQEKKGTGRINLGNFYLRRILRIWPLYFLIIAIGWIAWPYVHTPGEQQNYFLYYLFFLGNYAYASMRCIWIINPLWSVAVEEQFYAFWPLLVERSRVLQRCLVFLAAFLLIKIIAWHSDQAYYYFLRHTRIDCMAIGAILGCLNFHKSAILRPLFHPITQAICWGLFVFSLFRPLHFRSFVDDECFSVIVGILILNVSCNPRTLVTLENRVLRYIGRISYGIYAYNIPVLVAWQYLVPAERTKMISPYLLTVLVFGVNILIAHLSFHFFEKWFLKVRARFGPVSTAVAT